MNKRTDLNEDLIVDQYVNSRLSTIDLAKSYNASESAIRKLLIRKGVVLRNAKEAASNRAALNGEQLVQAEKRYIAGEDLTQISNDFGTVPSVLSRALKQRGVEIRPPGLSLLKNPDGTCRISRPPKISKEDLQREYVDKGVSIPEIAKSRGMNASSLYKAAERYGINRRDRSEAGDVYWKDKQCKEAVREDYKNNKKIEVIAAERGLSMATVSKYLHEQRVKVKPRGVPFGQSPDRIEVDMNYVIDQNTNQRRTMADIAAELGVSAMILSKRAKDNGYKPQNNKPKLVHDPFGHFNYNVRELARAINATECIICGEVRRLELAHVRSKEDLGPNDIAANRLCMCETCHGAFDEGSLYEEELIRLYDKLLFAQRHGFFHQWYEAVNGKVIKLQSKRQYTTKE